MFRCIIQLFDKVMFNSLSVCYVRFQSIAAKAIRELKFQLDFTIPGAIAFHDSVQVRAKVYLALADKVIIY